MTIYFQENYKKLNEILITQKPGNKPQHEENSTSLVDVKKSIGRLTKEINDFKKGLKKEDELLDKLDKDVARYY